MAEFGNESSVPSTQDDRDVLWRKIAVSFGIFAASNGGSAQQVLNGQDEDYYIYKAAANLYSIP